MPHIPKARKESILQKMLAPYPPTISALAEQEAISEATLYTWRKQLREEGHAVPKPESQTEAWLAQAKFAVVLETIALSEVELAEYCRSKGLYPEQVSAWREAAIQSQATVEQVQVDKRKLEREYVKKIKQLEGDVRRKDKALAEAAALLLLQKKLRALWEEGADE